jgi:hypothetical protein
VIDMATSGPPTTGSSGVPSEPFSQREIRVIRKPGVTGEFLTRWSDAELAIIDAEMARRRQESAAASAALFPQPHVVAQREAEQWARTRAAIPAASEARAALRQAHQVRSAAQGEVDQKREVLARAKGHLAAMEDELGAVEQAEERTADKAARGLAVALAQGVQPAGDAAIDFASSEDTSADTSSFWPDHVDRVGIARRRRDQATAALGIVEKDLGTAEAALTRAARDVEKAAEVVAADAWLRLSDEIDAAKSVLAELTERREGTGVWLSATGKITRPPAGGGWVRQLIVAPEAD